MAIETLRELAAAEIDVVAGGKKAQEAKTKIEELRERLRDTSDGTGSKGAGGANSLA